MAYDVIVCGQVSLDLHPGISGARLERIANPGKMFSVGPLEFTTGGAVPNTGLVLHRLGVQVGLMTNIGDDLMGDVLTTQIESFAPHLTALIKRVNGGRTPHTVVLSPQKSDRILWHHLGTNANFSTSDIDFAAVGQSKIFHLGYPPYLPAMIADDGAPLAEIFRRVKESGESGRVITSLDTAVPDVDTPAGQADWPAILRGCLPYVDIFLPSIEEIMFMMRREDYGQLDHLTTDYLRELADELLAMGCVVVGFKLGERGIFLKTGDDLSRLGQLPIKLVDWSQHEGWHPAYEVEVVGAVGAGDAAYAGFLAAMLRGLPPQEALRIACAVGASNVEAADAISSIPSWEGLHQRLDADWNLRK